MSRQLSILVFIIIAFVNSYANAGDDGKLKLNENKNGYVEVGDCFEKVNRGIFGFNQVLDKVIFKPLAKGYRMFPQPIRSGTSNALSNIGNVVTIPNNVLQGQFKDAGLNSARFVINSTLGIAGIFDVASYYGIKKRDKEDYGQTLGVWGAGPGCYFVLPVLGPTTIRDSIGSVVNMIGGKSWKIDDYYVGFFASINNILDQKYRTGGFEQGRNANYQQLLQDTNKPKRVFGPKYWYGRGTNYFLNLYFRF